MFSPGALLAVGLLAMTLLIATSSSFLLLYSHKSPTKDKI